MAEALRIAIVGAESTGKSTLATALAQRLAELTGLRCTAVPEWLRQWCDEAGRTPRPDEQPGIAEHQQALIDAAASTHDLVVCDTTALMTAVYSQMLFDDASLVPYAIAQQRRSDITLLTALDIDWVPDGLQRDGPQVRGPVDSRVRALLIGHRLPWALVAGQGNARLEAAVDAVAPLLRARATGGGDRREGGDGGEMGEMGERAGLFTGLAARTASRDAGPAGQRWWCRDCDDPDCEHALKRLQG